MICRPLRDLWGSLFRKAKHQKGASTEAANVLRLNALSVGLRIDRKVSVGSGREAETAEFIWVSPAGSSRSVKSLKVLLFPN